jgi:hypothetical protein
MKQTSVDWLVKQINGKSLNNVTIDIPKELIEQAKEMDKEQREKDLIDAFFVGRKTTLSYSEWFEQFKKQ